MNEGWVKIHRQIFENEYYFSEPFNKIMAWIDLILLANNAPGIFFKRGIKVEVERGQVGRDIDNLAFRWQWSRGKVERYLLMLENSGQIVRQKTNITSLISIVNYDTYQVHDKANGKTNDKASSKANEHQTVKQTDTNKNKENNKNENKEEEIIHPQPPQKGEIVFPELNVQLTQYKTANPNKYPEELYGRFLEYWVAPVINGKGKGKPLWETQKTWSLSGRLATWNSNQTKTPNGKKQLSPDESAAEAKRLLAAKGIR